MSINNPASNPEDGADVLEQNPNDASAAQKQPEAQEILPEISLTVAGPCKNPAGAYVSLSKAQRDKLGITEGGTVEIFLDGESQGIFTVGLGSKELRDEPQKFNANLVDAGKTVTLRKPANLRETTFSYPVSDIELNPDDEKLMKRKNIIETRFPDTDPEEYITLPTPVINAMLGDATKIGKISRTVIKFGGVNHAITVVPSGTTFGMTQKARQKLNIPNGLTNLRIVIEDGNLVIN